METTRIHISYAREDLTFVDRLLYSLAPLRTQLGLLWDTAELTPGTNWQEGLTKQADKADIILLIISPYFLISDYIYGIELKHILDKREKGLVQILPILARPCHWSSTPLGMFQAIPSHGRAISELRNPDEAYVSVVKAIETMIRDKSASQNIRETNVSYTIRGGQILNIHGNIVIGDLGNVEIDTLALSDVTDVFPLSGLPSITFVEPINFDALISAINHKGRGVILEGPSGVGKTTAVKKAIEKLDLNKNTVAYLSARDPGNIEKIRDLRNWHTGIVIIDDFHRLDEPLKLSLADYLKLLADLETKGKKLLIIGIPNTGIKLISFGHDLATRIDIFEFSQVEDGKIAELIEKGERALNIKLEKKSDIILASNGSLSVAQYLCYHSVIGNKVFKTQKITKVIDSNFSSIISAAKMVVSRRFEDFLFHFSRLGGKRDRTCIKLLKELASSNNGTINLDRFKAERSDLAMGIDNLISEKLIEELWSKNVDCRNFLFYDPETNDLVIDDPQLLFYLNNTSESDLASLSGKSEIRKREKVFISYSHKDFTYFERIMVHLKPLFRDDQIDVWSDQRIKPGQKWNKEIENALEETKVAILLISADFIASDYITMKELPALIRENSGEGATIVPLFISPANLNKFDNVTQYQGINSPNNPVIDLPENQRERVFVKLSQMIEELYATPI